MPQLALRVAYDGTAFRGWTDVRDAALRPALAKVAFGGGSLPSIVAASRTDAGVHAAGQVCSLFLPADDDDDGQRRRRSKDIDVAQLTYSLNQLLPAEVAVTRAALVGDAFDVRANRGKTYTYSFSTGASCRDPLTRLYEWQVPSRRGQPRWDPERVAALAACLRGAHDFTAFANTPRGPERRRAIDPICTLDEVTLARRRPQQAGTGWRSDGDDDGATDDAYAAGLGDAWTLTVRGDRFLYKMVRNLAGALIRVGCGELSTDEVRGALEAGAFAARPASMPLTAPAHGLVLRSVDYAPADDPFLVVA